MLCDPGETPLACAECTVSHPYCNGSDVVYICAFHDGFEWRILPF
jgi:hypothetical protein